MFIVLPIRTNVECRRTPYTNYALIGANVVFFLLSMVPALQGHIDNFMLHPDRPYLWQFVTFAFLHGGIAHILGNMFFLYLFGNNVNDKLGHLGYFCFYLAGAVFSGLVHAILYPSPIPLLGASGAVAAVTGAFLVLYPQTLITIFYWLIFIGTIDLPALYFIGFKLIIWDNVIERQMAHVAYDAHLAGYGLGIATMLLLLATGVISRNPMDMWAMIKRWNRKRTYRDAVSGGYDPFTGKNPNKKIWSKEVAKNKPESPEAEKIRKIRSEITDLLGSGRLSAAAEAYIRMTETDKNAYLARQQQLDIANQLMSMGSWNQAAEAYEKFLNHYSNYEYIEQVQLMLGLLYSRYLDKDQKARELLVKAREHLSDPGQRKMCENELANLSKKT